MTLRVAPASYPFRINFQKRRYLAVLLAPQSASDLGYKVYSWDEFSKLGESRPAAPVPPFPNDLSTIMYTSGTTGTNHRVSTRHACHCCCHLLPCCVRESQR